MGTKKRNLMYTLFANILTFLMGIVTGFIIPKALGVEDYGYIKLFTFYITYVGITHFGFLDGIYIKYGAYDYDDIPKEKFRGYFKYLLVLQVLEAIFMILGIILIGGNIDRVAILCLVAFNMIIANITTLFAFVHQFTKRFKVFSINIVLNKLIYIIGALILIYFNILGYMPFIILQTFINILILGIYIYINKEIVFGKSENIFKSIKEYKELTKNGFFIMIGNFTGVLIIGVDRLFVDKFFSLEKFAIYSFAYTLISLFFILLNSLMTVVYPYLSRMEEKKYKEVYENTRVILTIAMGITLIGYFFIKIIINNYLPKYSQSLPILIFLVPTVIYSAQINIVVANYYKILKLTKEYTKNNIIALAIGIITNVIAIIYFKSMEGIAMATLISFILWSIYSEINFKKIIGIRINKNIMLDLSIVLIFVATSIIPNVMVAIIAYIIALIVIILCFYKKEIINAIKMLKKS